MILDEPSSRSVVLAWEVPLGALDAVTSFYNTPVTGYTVQVWDRGLLGTAYRDWLSVSGPSTSLATLAGLHPGTRYSVRVLAQNLAGSTPSLPINITTNSSGMK